MDTFLLAEIGLRLLRRFTERSGIDLERGLAGTMLVTGIVANGLDEPNVK
ncbi:hypothetical protein ACFFWD_00020 [Bradyrhizobium erythrophlei]